MFHNLLLYRMGNAAAEIAMMPLCSSLYPKKLSTTMVRQRSTIYCCVAASYEYECEFIQRYHLDRYGTVVFMTIRKVSFHHSGKVSSAHSLYKRIVECITSYGSDLSTTMVG